METPQDEEAQLAAALVELEAKASRHITGLFASTLDDRAAFNAQLTQIREDLAALRAATRDLAILAEEQSTCVLNLRCVQLFSQCSPLLCAWLLLICGATSRAAAHDLVLRCSRAARTLPADELAHVQGSYFWCREEESERLADMLKGHQAEYERLQTAFKQANIQVSRGGRNRSRHQSCWMATCFMPLAAAHGS